MLVNDSTYSFKIWNDFNILHSEVSDKISKNIDIYEKVIREFVTSHDKR